MNESRLLFSILAAFTLAAALPGQPATSPPATSQPVASQPAAESEAVVPLEIVESPIAESAYRAIDGEREIDTVVIHFASAIYWFADDFQEIVGEEGKSYANSVGLTPENLAAHKYDWQLVKAIFEAYNVSSHYAIARDGTVVRFVAENDRASHAGRSTMPDDGRTGVNDFSIGIELMASHPNDDPTVRTADDAYTAAQYAALNRLIASICERHDIAHVVGHDEVAPERKTDPGPLFQWDRIRTDDYRPLACGD